MSLALKIKIKVTIILINQLQHRIDSLIDDTSPNYEIKQ